jgi:hypothetical protein
MFEDLLAIKASLDNEFYRLFEKLTKHATAIPPTSQSKEGINNELNDEVKVNVGGQIFETYQTTLTGVPGSMLAAMFSGKFKTAKGNILRQKEILIVNN